MKLEYVIVSSDDNPMYLDFWSIVKRLWIDKIDITPILIKIDNTTELIDEGDGGFIQKIKKVEGINTGFQSQIARLYASILYDNKNILLSDIDMLPLNKNYFINIAKNIPEDKIGIYSSDAYNKNTINPKFNIKNRYPICYIAGKTNILSKVLDINFNFEVFVKKLHKLNYQWDTDEVYMSKQLDKYPEKLVKFNRGWTNNIANGRIDRVVWNYNKELLMKDKYIDCHSIRPYKNYKKEIDILLNYTTTNNIK